MSKSLTFSQNAWEEYLYWQTQDKKTLKKINQLLQDVQRDPFDGLGKPEPLKEDKVGIWSRRIDDANRLLYRVTDTTIEIVQCKGHYSDK